MKELNEYKQYFEIELNKKLEYIINAEQPISDAVVYAIKGEGKRIRPILAMFGAEFVGKSRNDVLDIAIGVECIHNYSLVHDDLPCMDNDDLRHGKLSTHKKFGEGIGVLAGDALLNLAFELMLNSSKMDTNCIKGISYISKQAGILGMIGGQCIDMLPLEDRDKTLKEVVKLYMLKTACLFKASVVGGSIAMGATKEEINDLEIYCENLGLIFQIVDDILDITSTEEVLGKPICSDNGKKLTYLDIVGKDKAISDIKLFEDTAINALVKYGDRSDKLIKLCKYLTNRIK